MTISGICHDTAKKHMLDGAFPWASMTPKAMLVLAGGWTPAAANNFVQTAITAGATELAVSGYARQSLANMATTQDDPNTRALADADNFEFSGMASGGSFDTLIVFNFVTNDSDSWLIATFSLGQIYTTAATGDVIFAVNAAGLLALA